MIFKKVFSGFLAVTCAAVCSVSAMAGNIQQGEILSHQIDNLNIPVSRGISPRFKYLNSISARMVQEKGKATITGSALVYDPSYKTTLTITVQRSKDGKSWSDMQSWSVIAENNDFAVIEKNYYLARGYSYRSVTEASIDSGSGIEIVNVVSSTVYY